MHGLGCGHVEENLDQDWNRNLGNGIRAVQETKNLS